MRKPLTRERIERGYRIWMGVVWSFRAVVVGFLALLIFVLASGEAKPVMWVYLVLPPIWWATTVLWKLTAKSTRESQLYTLKRAEEWR